MKKFFKLTAWLLFLCSLITSMFITPAALADNQPETGDTVEFANPSFEEVTEAGSAKGWSSGTWGVHAFVDDSVAHTGKNSLKITTTQGGNPWVCQTVSLYPGGVYEMSVWLNTQLSDVAGRGAGFKFEHYKENGSSAGGDSVGETYMLSTNNMWVNHKTTFTVPEDAVTSKIYLRLYCNGIAWFDDVTLTFTGGPEKFSFYNDHVFMYPDEEKGTATLSLNAFYSGKGIEKDYKAEFKLVDDETKEVVFTSSNIEFENEKVDFVYTPDIMPKMHHKYVLYATVTGNGETYEFYDNMYKYERPSSMQKDGTFIFKDGGGERFNPIIAYHVDREAYPKMQEAGINVVQMGYGNAVYAYKEQREETLNALAAHNLKGLFCLYIDMKPAGHPDNLENIKKVVEEHKDDDRIFAWAIMDEPLGAGPTREKMDWLEESYKAIREIDTYHPIYVLDFDHHELTLRYCDVFVADIYAHGNDTRFVSGIIERLNKIGRINTYELAATYKQNNVFPPTNSIRGSIYRAFEGGSSGVGYYSISDAIGHDAGDVRTPLYKLDVWPDFVTLNKVEIPILFDYFVNEKAIHFNAYKNGPATEEIMWFQWFIGDDMYLLVHNRGRNTENVRIPLESANGRIKIGDFTAEPIGLTTQKAISGSGKIELSMASEEMALFKIKTEGKIDFSELDKSRFTDLVGFEWAEKEIEALAALGIANQKGDGLFAPAEPITRGDFAMFLVRAVGLSDSSDSNFDDVSAEAEYAKELAAGKKAGLLKGVGGNNFNPEGLITRQEVMTLLARGLEMAQKRVQGNEAVLDAFSDKSLIADWAVDSVRDVVASGIITGNADGTLNPLGNTTRAEAAVIIKRVLDAPVVPQNAQQNPQGTQTPEVPEQKIEFTSEVSEAQIERWQAAERFLTSFGMKESRDLNSSITWEKFEKIVSDVLGFAFKTNNEAKSAVSYEKAIEEMVSLIGYDSFAKLNGGILIAASRADLLNGVGREENGYIRTGDVYVLFKNALEAQMFEGTTFGADGALKYQLSDETLLSRYLKIKVYEGRVDSNFYISLTGNTSGRDEVAINGKRLKVGATNAPDLLGMPVKAYVSEIDDDIIIHIEPKKNVSVKVIDSLDIAEDKSNLSRIAWYGENYKVNYESISPSAYIVVNGKVKNTGQVSDIIPKNGTMTFISESGGEATVVFAEDFTDRIVNRVDKESKTVYFKDGTQLVLDKEINKRLRLETKDGGTFKVEELKEWNVLSISVDSDQNPVKAILSTEKVEGVLTENSKKEAVINDKKYSYAYGVNLSPEIGKKASFYLNSRGQIVATNSTVAPNYGYFIRIAEKAGIEKKVQIRMFTASGELKTFNVADKVKLNSDYLTKSELANSRFLMVDKNTPRSQLVIYNTNSNDEITEIITAVDGNGVDKDDRDAVFTLDVQTGETALSRVTGYTTKVIAQNYIIAGDVIAFIVPSTPSDDIRDYSIEGYSYFTHGQRYENALLYDVDKDREVKAIVQKTAVSNAAKNSAPQGIVLKRLTVLNDDGEVATAIEIMTTSGSKEVLKFLSEDFAITLGAKAITNPALETEVTINSMGVRTVNATMAPGKLNFGDVVNYETNAMGYVTGMNVLFRAKSPSVREVSEEGLSQEYDYSNLTRAYGQVTDATKNGIIILPGQWERLYTFTVDGQSHAGIVIVDMNKMEAKLGAKEDIQVGDKVFATRTNPYVNFIIVYR